MARFAHARLSEPYLTESSSAFSATLTTTALIHVGETPRFSGGKPQMYSGNRPIFTRVCVPLARSSPLLRHDNRTVIGRHGHAGEHGVIDIY